MSDERWICVHNKCGDRNRFACIFILLFDWKHPLFRPLFRCIASELIIQACLRSMESVCCCLYAFVLMPLSLLMPVFCSFHITCLFPMPRFILLQTQCTDKRVFKWSHIQKPSSIITVWCVMLHIQMQANSGIDRWPAIKQSQFVNVCMCAVYCVWVSYSDWNGYHLNFVSTQITKMSKIENNRIENDSPKCIEKCLMCASTIFGYGSK